MGLISERALWFLIEHEIMPVYILYFCVDNLTGIIEICPAVGKWDAIV